MGRAVGQDICAYNPENHRDGRNTFDQLTCQVVTILTFSLSQLNVPIRT